MWGTESSFLFYGAIKLATNNSTVVTHFFKIKLPPINNFKKLHIFCPKCLAGDKGSELGLKLTQFSILKKNCKLEAFPNENSMLPKSSTYGFFIYRQFQKFNLQVAVFSDLSQQSTTGPGWTRIE